MRYIASVVAAWFIAVFLFSLIYPNLQAGVKIASDAEVDEDGTQIVRVKFAGKGWTYMARGLEIETSQLDSLVNDQEDGTSWGDTTLKCYNASSVEVTVQATADTECVETRLDFEPLYNYSVVSANAIPLTAINQDVRVWAVAVPDLPYNLGGSRVMINGINIRYKSGQDEFNFDGRTSKRLLYDATYHTNKIRVKFKHPAGFKAKIHVIWNHYRP